MSKATAYIIAFLIIALMIWYYSKKEDRLKEEGKIVNREPQYWRLTSYFSTQALKDAIFSSLQSSAVLSENKINVQQGSAAGSTLIFSYKNKWTAELTYSGEKDGSHRYEFSFPHMTTRNGSPYGETEMNITLTAVEKAFLALDPNTTVRTREGQYKSKVKLF